MFAGSEALGGYFDRGMWALAGTRLWAPTGPPPNFGGEMFAPAGGLPTGPPPNFEMVDEFDEFAEFEAFEAFGVSAAAAGTRL